MTAVPLRAAALELGKSEATLRRWIAEGAPTARPGEVGRGRGALVCVQDLKNWRATEAAGTPDASAFLANLERILADYLRGGDHRLVGLRDEPARLLYAALLEYIVGRLNRAGG